MHMYPHVHTHTHTQTTSINSVKPETECKTVTYNEGTSTPTECDIHASTSPGSDVARANQHTPDSGIALSGYQSSHSGNDSLSPSGFPKNIQEQNEVFDQGQIVNADIQAAKKRSRSLSEINSTMTTLSFVPNSTSSPPPLITVSSNPRPTSSIATPYVQRGRIHSQTQLSASPPQRTRLYSTPTGRGMIPLSHAPSVAARGIGGCMDAIVGKPSPPSTYLQFADRFASTTQQGIPSYQMSSSPYPGYGTAYGSTHFQSPSAYPPSYNGYTANSAPPYLTHSAPAGSSLYHSTRPTVPPPYGAQYTGIVPTPPQNKPLGYMSYSTNGHTHTPTTIPLTNSCYGGYSTISNQGYSPYASYNQTTSSSTSLSAANNLGMPVLGTTAEATKVPKPIAPKSVLSVNNSNPQANVTTDMTKIMVGTPRIVRKSSRIDSQSSIDEGEHGGEEGSKVEDEDYGEQLQLYTKT